MCMATMPTLTLHACRCGTVQLRSLLEGGVGSVAAIADAPANMYVAGEGDSARTHLRWLDSRLTLVCAAVRLCRSQARLGRPGTPLVEGQRRMGQSAVPSSGRVGWVPALHPDAHMPAGVVPIPAMNVFYGALPPGWPSSTSDADTAAGMYYTDEAGARAFYAQAQRGGAPAGLAAGLSLTWSPAMRGPRFAHEPVLWSMRQRVSRATTHAYLALTMGLHQQRQQPAPSASTTARSTGSNTTAATS
jgi:hypothetical protein